MTAVFVPQIKGRISTEHTFVVCLPGKQQIQRKNNWLFYRIEALKVSETLRVSLVLTELGDN